MARNDCKLYGAITKGDPMKKKVYLLIILFLLLQGFAMPTTSPLIVLTMGNAEIDAVASPDTHARADIDDLLTGDAQRSLKYATYEPDKWLLDGSFHFAPDPANIGFVSSAISDASGNFTADPVLTITLDAAIDIEQGVSFEFSRISSDFCDSLKVEYKDASSVLIDDYTYSPDEYNYFAEIDEVDKPVEDVKYIVVTFYSTNTPYRHLKLLDIYIDGVIWDKSDIETANIIEQIDPSSVTLPSNELTFSIYDSSGDFSIVDPQGVYAGLRRKQKIDVHEFVDDERIYMGRFYLDDWKSKSANLAAFEAVGALSQLGKEKIMGRWIDGYTWNASDVMDCIMGHAICQDAPESEIEYEIDSSLSNIQVEGWIPITNRREALQQLAIAIGGYLDESRSDKITIRPLELSDNLSSWDFVFDDSDIANPDVTTKPLITGIKIVAHTFTDTDYTTNTDHVVFDETVNVGEIIVYAKGGDSADILGLACVDTSNPDNTAITSVTCIGLDNYAKFTVTSGGRLIIYDSKRNVHNRINYYIDIPNVPSGTPENILVIENATLINPDNVAEIAARLAYYYSQQYTIETKLFATEMKVGDSAKIDTTQNSKQISGIAEEMSFDLAGGFLQKAKVSGVILPFSRGWYGVEYLALGGGGAGASHELAGGGGAGEILHGIELLTEDEVYNIVIGVGGVGVANGSGSNGGDTTFAGKTAHGGGHGGKGSNTSTAAEDGGDGGNGGGGGGNDGGSLDGTGGIGNRHNGGEGSNGASNYGGGGGGGNDEDGKGGYSGATHTGYGGDGLESDITGSSVTYGGGGGGIGKVDTGLGGDGGGGDGNRSGVGVNGTDYLGGGGGAGKAGSKGGDGGIGNFILRILTAYYSGTTTGSPTVTTDGDYTVLEYHSNGSYTA